MVNLFNERYANRNVIIFTYIVQYWNVENTVRDEAVEVAVLGRVTMNSYIKYQRNFNSDNDHR